MPFVRTGRRTRIQPARPGYRRRRGMGQDDTSGDIQSLPVTDVPVMNIPLQQPIVTGTPVTPVTPTTSPSALSFLMSIPGLAQTGIKAYQEIQGPGLVPGTNAIYNPLTGQYYNPTTGQVVNPTGATLGTSPIASSLPILLIGGGVIMVALFAFGGRKS
jgi:hypothetical protein